MSKVITIALAGNPNTGKTSLFNAITGSHQKVGNYAGVTVEKREGVRLYRGYEFRVFDLPGIYSLTAYSLDEVVARDFIIDEKPDLVVDVIDSTNIERNLYLCLQFQELRVPIVAALNLDDEAAGRGIRIDDKRLSEILRMPVVRTVGVKGYGVEWLLDRAIQVFETKSPTDYPVSYGAELEDTVGSILRELQRDAAFAGKYPMHWFAVKLLEKDARAIELLSGHRQADAVKKVVCDCIRKIEEHFGRDAAVVVAEQRYGYIHGAVAEAVRREPLGRETVTEVFDKFLLDRFLGLPVFLLILWLMFQITFKIGAYPMGWLEAFFSGLGAWVSAIMPAGLLRSLLVDGVIAGVGGVTSFVPLIILLFLFISILEDSGYMARSAFIMDKFLHVFGLHGQSFLPMIIGFGCSVPAVMAARTLKNTRDRIITVMVMPFMSCGAKLPVHVLLAGAFFGAHAGSVVLSIYIIGVALALFSSLLFRATVLRGESTPFVMELPPYRMPTLKGILWHVTDKTTRYLQKAGMVLLPASVLIWALTTFPKMPADPAGDVILLGSLRSQIEQDKLPGSGVAVEEMRLSAEARQRLAEMRSREALAFSYAGRMGKAMEPLLSPLGFDWKIGISAVTGLAAKEMVVSTLGVLYKVGAVDRHKGESLREALRKDPVFTPLVAYVLMLFTLIVVPCLASLSAMYAEIGWRWVAFAVCYWSVLAWVLCFLVYQGGRMMGWGL
ncbi:MAG: ferrous iron transport protein B [Candidatus Omnitrophica bacterium]|nr:ferrous iron transport protein B [Candidatus Omnitrophota bacterium]